MFNGIKKVNNKNKILIILIAILLFTFGFLVPNNLGISQESDEVLYMQMQEQIKKNWHPPRSKKSKIVKVLFQINKDGSLGECKIKKSSGNPKIDLSALFAIEDTQPFDKVPDSIIKDPKGFVEVLFTFDYKVHKE